VSALIAASISITSRHTQVLEQAVLCDFVKGGHFGRHLRRMREIYAGRLSTLLEGAKRSLRGLLEISSVEAGLQTAGWLGEGLRAESTAKEAALRDIEVNSLSRYARGRAGRDGLLLGFAAVDEREIRRGVRELAGVLESGKMSRQRM
jgi:GntR family transcriptional regulator/MocR family aminotransferase